MSKPKYEYYKIFQQGHEGDSMRFTVKGYGTYERYSVLAGQTKICFLDAFETEAAARIAFPQLPTDGTEWGSKFMDQGLNRMPNNPPNWFDPMDAGEEW